MNEKIVFFVLIIITYLSLMAAVQTDADKRIFEYNCSRCHNIERVLEIEKTSLGWEKTVDWMRFKSEDSFSKADASAIKRYIKKIHAAYAEQLFKIKCAKCHPWEKSLGEKLTYQQWKNRVMSERNRSVGWIALDEAEEIALYLSRNSGYENVRLDEKAQARDLTEKKCLRCHVYESVFKIKKTRGEWQAVNNRMREKSSEWITEEELGQITEYLSGLENNKR